MPKIITFTANLLAETTYQFDSWKLGRASRAKSQTFQVGGKGINVSKMLNRLEAENAALCFPGGDYGPMCEHWLASAGISIWPFREGCEVRCGAVGRAPEQPETTWLGVESEVSKAAIQAAVDALKQESTPFIFAVCGSVQHWEDDRWEPLREWVRNRDVGVALAVDNYGPSLAWFAGQAPAIVKCNRDELETLFPAEEREHATDRLLVEAAARLAPRRWVVTDGGNPIWVKEASEAPVSFDPPPVKLVSATGCGDVFFATLLDCLYNKEGFSLLEASKRAADYASRSAAMPGIAEFEL